MKTSEFRKWILKFCKILESADAPTVANSLARILDIFDGHETKTVASFLKSANKIAVPLEVTHPTIAKVLPTLYETSAWLENCAKPPYNNDLNLFLQFLQTNESVNIEAFVNSVVSALKQKPKTKRKPVRRNLDQKQIDKFIQRLTANFENEESFMSICDELRNDNNITQLDAVAIARGIDSRTPARASKNVALKRVIKRFEELKESHDDATSMQGRSAA